MLAALQQQRNDQVLLVVEMAQEVPAEVQVGVVEAGERSAEPSAVNGLRGEDGVGALHDPTDRGVQGRVVVLEQLEAGRKARLRPPENGEIVNILDLMMLLEAAERPAQVPDQPGLEVRGLGALAQRRTPPLA